jgi:hypothetical protein
VIKTLVGLLLITSLILIIQLFFSPLNASLLSPCLFIRPSISGRIILLKKLFDYSAFLSKSTRIKILASVLRLSTATIKGLLPWLRMLNITAELSILTLTSTLYESVLLIVESIYNTFRLLNKLPIV